jgi:hypothetical protein
MALTSPDIQAPRSLLADWLEIVALESRLGRATRSALDSIWRFTAEERSTRRRRDPSTGLAEDGEIADTQLENIIEDVLRELEWRASVLGPAYPFSLVRQPTSGDPLWELVAVADPADDNHVVYTTCLLIVAYRRHILPPDDPHVFTDHYLGLLFQICSCLAVGGHVGADVVSFGWPRSTGEAFLPALKSAWGKFGGYNIVDTPPDGAPKRLQDGGIDIIAWRQFSDGRGARVLIFGQAASGDNWVGKSASGPADTLVSHWFVGSRPRFWLSCYYNAVSHARRRSRG